MRGRVLKDLDLIVGSLPMNVAELFRIWSLSSAMGTRLFPFERGTEIPLFATLQKTQSCKSKTPTAAFLGGYPGCTAELNTRAYAENVANAVVKKVKKGSSDAETTV